MFLRMNGGDESRLELAAWQVDGAVHHGPEELGEALAAPHPLYRKPKHPYSKHVKKQVVEAAMQESVADQLPGLEIAAIHGPQGQVRGNIVQQKYSDANDDNRDGDRWLRNARNFCLLNQRNPPVINHAGYNSTMAENKRIDTHHIKQVTVYASSSQALQPVYYEAARRLGEILAGAGKSIIYGAGGHGLMGAVADGALSRNGKVYGVVPDFLQKLELTHRGLTGLRVVGEMRLRKQLMLEGSSAVVALPGGCGTIEELFEALTLKRLGQWVGPIVLVNTNGFYDDLIRFLNHSVAERFMGNNHLDMWSVVNEPECVLDAIDGARDWDSGALQFANVTPANA